MAWADVSDVSDRLGRDLTTAETVQVSVLLSDAEWAIRRRIPELDASAAGDETFRRVLVRIEARAVQRVLMNPTGARQVSDSVDDYSHSETLDTSLSRGELYISDAEWTELGAGGSGGSGSFSMAWGYAL